jgi:hypothetical protein
MDPSTLHDDQLIDTWILAAWLGVKYYTPVTWRHHKKGPPYLRMEHTVRYRVRDVRAWLEDQQRGAQPLSTADKAGDL